MDFGVVGLEGFAGSVSASTTGAFASDAERKQKWYGSGLGVKHQRSPTPSNEDDWRRSKLPKTEDFSARDIPLRSNGSVFSDGQPQMLCFSTPKSESSVAFPHLNRNSGYSGGNLNGGNMHGGRGPFTPSQWMELEHQALIYKYINANVPVPSHLLLPIKKAFDAVTFSAFSCGLLGQSTFGWGGFHLGFANSSDPEPGRCRRTDGKKWRCSRDAVADQKYCERHMNRGRHRSRKPVEGQTGHPSAAASGTTAKLTSTSLAPALGSGGGPSSSTILQPQLKNLQSCTVSDLSRNRMFLNRESASESPAGLSEENPFLLPKQLLAFEESSTSVFGVVSSDSLLNPSNKSSSVINSGNFGSAPNLSGQETQPQHFLRQFMDNWPRTQSNRPAISWPEIDPQSDKAQLSISLPMAASGFMSSTSSPAKEKLTLSPLRLSRVQRGLGAECVISEPYQRQANWIPISWETSLGGPLGEVLHNTNNSTADCGSSSALNLMTDGWDNSPRLGSSPTGVLQKTSFNSLSNSSTGSSPRAEIGNKFCEDGLGPSLVHAASLPAL